MTTNQSGQTPSSQSAAPLTYRFPFTDKDKKEVTDPQVFFNAFGAVEDGYFPLGVNGFPHGGVHFGAGSAAKLDQGSGVRCIADGDIVAFKLDDAYPHLRFSQDRRWAMFSTGFVLVRHHMTMPRAPNSVAVQPSDETLEFYSLYMHIADWTTYLSNGDLVRPGWWPGVDAYRILKKDRQQGDGGATGAFVYAEPKAGGQRNQFAAGDCVGFLPEGSEVTIGETRGSWGHIVKVTAGAMVSPTSGGIFGTEDQNVPWVLPDSLSDDHPTVTPLNDWGWVNLHEQRPVKEPNGVGQIVVPAQPIPVKAGTLMGHLGQYHDYERSTQLPPNPTRPLLHLEVFAGERFAAFLEKSRARAAALPPDQKTILVITTGAKLAADAGRPDAVLPQASKFEPLPEPASGRWARVQPKKQTGNTFVSVGAAMWVERTSLSSAASGTPAWSRFPLDLAHMADPANGAALTYSKAYLNTFDVSSQAIDEQKRHWWRLQIGDANGKTAWGWVCEQGHPATQWQSPWAWPGFDVVDGTGIKLADAFKRSLVVTGSTNRDEAQEFEPSMSAVNNSALLQKLEEAVSQQQGGSKSGKLVTPRALQQAMQTRWLAQQLSHIVLRYESEWGGNIGRWDEITPLMRNAAENWQCELQRIKALQWWGGVKGAVPGFPNNAVVHHVNPIALVTNFQTEGLVCAHCGSDVTITSQKLQSIFSNISLANADGFSSVLTSMFKKYEINTCHRISHFLGQCEVECGGFTAFREGLNYSNGDRLWSIYPTALKAGLRRAHPGWTDAQCEEYTKAHLVKNDQGLGEVLFGEQSYPGRDYRGRGLLHVTWFATYNDYKSFSGIDVTSDPTKLENDRFVAADSSGWFWNTRSINIRADKNNPKEVTKVINPALKDFARRTAAARRAFSVINNNVGPCKQEWESTLTGANGW